MTFGVYLASPGVGIREIYTPPREYNDRGEPIEVFDLSKNVLDLYAAMNKHVDINVGGEILNSKGIAFLGGYASESQIKLVASDNVADNIVEFPNQGIEEVIQRVVGE